MPSGVVHNLADVKNIIFFIKIKLFRRLFNELMVGYFCTFFTTKGGNQLESQLANKITF